MEKVINVFDLPLTKKHSHSCLRRFNVDHRSNKA